MKSRNYLHTLVIGALIAAGLATLTARTVMANTMEAVETVLLAEVFLSTFNIVLLSALTANYLKMTRKLSTPMTRSLLIFSSALTLYAVTSSPIIHYMLNINPINIGPLTYIPEIFVTIASLTLLYQNYR
ncbi:hypothetical protein [Candidatus Nanohalococcus occultus]